MNSRHAWRPIFSIRVIQYCSEQLMLVSVAGEIFVLNTLIDVQEDICFQVVDDPTTSKKRIPLPRRDALLFLEWTA
jgi:hypothetical protein